MTIEASRENETFGAVLGWQRVIRGTNTAVSGTPVVSDLAGTAKLTGVALPTGTYFYFIPTSGSAAVDVTLRSSAATGTGLSSTVTIFKTMQDCVTEKMNAAGASAAVTMASPFVNGTQVTASITNLRGERGIMLKIVVPATSTLTFDQAEHSSL